MQIEVPESFLERAQQYQPQLGIERLESLAKLAMEVGLDYLTFTGETEPAELDPVSGCRTFAQFSRELTSWLNCPKSDKSSFFEAVFLCLRLEQPEREPDRYGIRLANEVIADVGRQLRKNYESCYHFDYANFVVKLGNRDGENSYPAVADDVLLAAAFLDIKVSLARVYEQYTQMGIEWYLKRACRIAKTEEPPTLFFNEKT